MEVQEQSGFQAQLDPDYDMFPGLGFFLLFVSTFSALRFHQVACGTPASPFLWDKITAALNLGLDDS